ncbi:ABC transporter substrate-binding protein [Terrihabitans sp. B22-R8]|uniref:ABC transporter substrate-binding protein n=1 Tax=Terrihabitans sp. B22-R8 TaxID=3425128 RepID=UPI00403CF2FC
MRRLFAGLALTLLASAAPLTAALADTPVRIVLNWKYQGPQALFFLAEDKGYFREAGLDVTIDQGEGSAASITKVATGAYDVGFGDINALIALAATRPEQAPIGVYQMFNTPPFAIAVKAGSPIEKPADLVGKTIGGPANDGALKLFPAFTEAAGIDASKVTITNMQPNLREQMLMSGQVDGVFGYVNTIAFSAKSAGIDPEKDLRFIAFGDYGLDLYSNALVSSKAFAAKNPEALKSLVAALNRATADMIADPDGSVAAVMKREPLLNEAVEIERTKATLDAEMNHPEIGKIGLGAIDPDRMKRAIDVVVKANALPRTPALEEVFTDAFLPPLADRPTKVVN